jgi:hypothetical protein
MRKISLLSLALAVPLTLVACGEDDKDDGDDGESTDVDSDGDGTVDADDCAPDDAEIYPGATEVCDEVDNNCDGQVDEGVTTVFYGDADGDGHGGENLTVEACEAPDGYTDSATDCDDLDAAVNPDTVWYADVDGDGYGASLYTTTACEQPSGYVADSSDCSDLDANINPAATEVCDGGIDNDCNGTADDDDAGVDTSTFSTWYADSDGDGYGDAGTSTASCAVPSDYVADDQDCDDTASDVNPGETEVCNDGLDNDCSGDAPECGGLPAGTWTVADADYTLTGDNSSDYFGRSLAVLDMDGDGQDDLAVGAWGNDDGDTSAGQVSIFGGVTASGSASATADVLLTGDEYYGCVGYAVADGGDVNGDGYDDLLVGGDGTSSYRGAAYVVYGAASASGEYTLGDVAPMFTGTSGYDYLGNSVTGLGDIDGDGYDDIGLGAYGDDDNGGYSGSLFIIYGSAFVLTGGAIADTYDAQIYGSGSSAYVGYYTSTEGKADFDGDGYGDFVVGAYYSANSNHGGAYFMYGDGSRLSGSVSVEDADANWAGTGVYDYFGRTVEIGDITGDGYDDALVWEYYGGSDTGAVHVLAGGATQYAGDYDASTDAAFAMTGLAQYDYFGRAMAVGDFNNDGQDDLLVGAGGVDTGGSTAGAMYAFMGPLSAAVTAADADTTVNGDASGQNLGYYGVEAGDMDGDGADDIIGGAQGDTSSTGAAFIFLGGGM